MAAAKFTSVTSRGGKVITTTSNRKGASKGRLITGAKGRAIGRNSPGRVTTVNIRNAAAGGSSG